MIVISDKLNQKKIEIPKNVFPTGGTTITYRLEITNGMTNKSTTLEVNDISNYKNYYSFYPIDFSGFEDGEYKYKLKANDDVVGYGLMQIGNYEMPKTNYNPTTTTKQYNPI